MEIIKDLEGFIAIRSVLDENDGFAYGKSIDDALNYILDLAGAYGFNTSNLDGQVGIIEYGDSDKAVGVLAHCDVVPEGSGWLTDPFVLTEIDGKLYGRGSIDDKGPIIACLHALKEIKDQEIKLDRKIQIIIGTDEETLWRGISRFTDSEKMPELGFTPDGSFPLIHAEKGILDFDISFDLPLDERGNPIEISGGMSRNSVPDTCSLIVDGQNHTYKGQSCHAMQPEKGENAICKALMDLSKKINHPSLQTFSDLIGLDYYGKKAGCDFEDDISGKLTFNLGKISVNKEKMHMNINVRYPVTSEPSLVLERFESVFSDYGYDLIDHLEPLYVDKDHAIVTSLMETYQEHTGDYKSKPMVIGGGTYARVMKNMVSFGPVYPDQEELAHEANEYIEKEKLFKLVDIYKDAMIRLSHTIV
ncbi:M20 family metallopeptidase [Acidaminobacter sp. JC074]|uniref:Sapep family Mn(2+)-dependent dipeptidase n=1 Tax=Acidaminobacter sp. JC074 TaxID=2530199 RepID=UPI001F1109A3|nr:Sapep family Mn(2+)-dependent dipeptidase [Acidaminobacter sp. JC074]MCH4890123.1 M20 family metallopeptidase [Acidaminobacter sp. JC074]